MQNSAKSCFWFVSVTVALFSTIVLSEDAKSEVLVPCSLSDPKVNECLLKESPRFFAAFVNEYPMYKTKVRDPLKIKTFSSKTGDSSIGLIFTLSNNLVYGQSKDEVKSLKIDQKKREITAKIHVPKLRILGDYEMSGRVLILPITGKGKGNITCVNVNLDLNVKYDYVKKNGAKYLKIKSFNYKFHPERTYLHFDNLFNGDKYLGDNMNQFMNENYKEMQQSFTPVFEKTFSEEDETEFNKIFDNIPIDQILLP